MTALTRSAYVSALLILLTFSVCAQTPTSQTATLTAGSASITDFKGEVHVQNANGSAVPPQRGQVLTPESVVETGKGRVILTLQDGSQVLVQAHTRVTLKDPAKGESFLQQWLGRILVKAQKRLGGAPSFKMGTPSAVISVRGTQFEVAVNRQHKTSVSVLEGQVEVRGLHGTGVLLGPGFGTSVIENEEPEHPYQIPSSGAHSSGGSNTRYQREDDWPSGRPQNGDPSESPNTSTEAPEIEL